MTILYVVGARPNFVKMAPVIAELRRRTSDERHVLVHTGQHYDYTMSKIFFDELRVPAPDHSLDIGSASHAVQTARVMERLEPVLLSERPDLVIVPGDVNSTLAATLVAAKLSIPLAHIEAGLRSFDRSMPEEINRIVADEFSEHLFLHSDEAIANLRAEGINDARMHFGGNTMIDSLVALEQHWRNAGAPERQGVAPGEYMLVTLHRPALVDGPLLADVFSELEAVSRELPILFPVHPRTRKMLDGRRSNQRVQLIEPVGYIDFLSLEANAAAVLTDSGGVQEETTFLGVPCFTLRQSTERPVTVRLGTNVLLGLAPERIAEIPALLRATEPRTAPPPLWDARPHVESPTSWPFDDSARGGGWVSRTRGGGSGGLRDSRRVGRAALLARCRSVRRAQRHSARRPPPPEQAWPSAPYAAREALTIRIAASARHPRCANPRRNSARPLRTCEAPCDAR